MNVTNDIYMNDKISLWNCFLDIFDLFGSRRKYVFSEYMQKTDIDFLYDDVNFLKEDMNLAVDEVLNVRRN